MLQLCGIMLICGLLAAIICLATKNGQQAAKLSSLKRELDAIYRAQELEKNIAVLSPDAARRKLCEIATQQRSRMSDR